MQEHFVGVPEEGGHQLISQDPLPPGSVYTAALAEEDIVALHRIDIPDALNDTGVIRRYWAAGPLPDLNQALRCWEPAVLKTPGDSPEHAAILNVYWCSQ